MALLANFNYSIAIIIAMIGLYIIIGQGNLVKKLLGLNIFQTSVFLLYISMGKISGGTAPIHFSPDATYSNPLPHVLILTAIVVGVATLSVGLAIVVRIQESYGTIEDEHIRRLDQHQENSAND
jgi:multicomponent Na+:H+ antiporter subunit C